MVYTRSPDYLYRRNGIYYFTRNVPSDLKARFNKSRVVVSLHTRSIVKAQKSALALCERLDRYFESLRLERFHSKALALCRCTVGLVNSSLTCASASLLMFNLKSFGYMYLSAKYNVNHL